MPGFRTAAPQPARKSLLHQPGVLLFVVVVCAAFVFGHFSRTATFFESLQLSQGSHLSALSPLVYGLFGLVAFLILIGVLRAAEFLLHGPKRTSPLGGRAEKSLEQFVEEATCAPAPALPEGAGGDVRISTRVAREGHNLLERFYPKPVCIELGDDLREHLGLTEEQVITLRSSLLSDTDRREDSEVSVQEIRTVRHLLRNVEKAPLQHLNKSVTPVAVVSDRSGARTRATDHERAAAARTASPAASAKLPSGPSTSAGQDSGLRRRANDYSGPRRRMTDQLPEPVYRGPYRRMNDPASGSRPRATTSGERRIEQTSAELSKLDPLPVPRRNRPRTSEET